MKTLVDFITEAGVGAAGSISYKLDPVGQSIINKADLNKIYQQIKDNVKIICNYNDELGIYTTTDSDYRSQWGYREINGKRVIFLGFEVEPVDCDFHTREDFGDTLNKFLFSTYSIKPSNSMDGLSNSVPIKPSKNFNFSVPNNISFQVAVNKDTFPNFYLVVDIDDIADIWSKFNGNIVDFNFKKFGTPGGANDVAGRTLQEGDIVAFMRRAGTGGMEMGVVQSVKKRITINTEYRNTVTLDGSQVCLVQRGNLVVS